MMTNETLRKLNELKLFGMAHAVDEQLSSPSVSHLAFEDRLGLIVDQEFTYRDNKRLQRLLKNAKLRETDACVEDIDYRVDRGLDRSEMATLAMCTWIKRGLNLIITGATGNGKTWLACALGNQACRHGLTVSFQRVSLLLEELAISHVDGTFRKTLDRLAKVDLLILDDFGISALNAGGRSDLLEVIEQRTGSHSTLVTSQLPVDRWHDYLGGNNPTIADAILDRLVTGAERVVIKGNKSMRATRKTKKGQS
ncbi:IS21-like element helper ATPase IstB [Herbaspirillum huttiense]|uniref:IS21-like element helper ATPase IstB n=1 Tax=Herbaspirillum huttiense TaxID=863372 RepID=UPI0039AFC533